MRGMRPHHPGHIGPIPVVIPVPISTLPAAGAHSDGGGGITPILLGCCHRLPFFPAFCFPHFIVLFLSSWFARPSSSPSPGPCRCHLPPCCWYWCCPMVLSAWLHFFSSLQWWGAGGHCCCLCLTVHSCPCPFVPVIGCCCPDPLSTL